MQKYFLVHSIQEYAVSFLTKSELGEQEWFGFYTSEATKGPQWELILNLCRTISGFLAF